MVVSFGGEELVIGATPLTEPVQNGNAPHARADAVFNDLRSIIRQLHSPPRGGQCLDGPGVGHLTPAYAARMLAIKPRMSFASRSEDCDKMVAAPSTLPAALPGVRRRAGLPRADAGR